MAEGLGCYCFSFLGSSGVAHVHSFPASWHYPMSLGHHYKSPLQS